MPSFQWYHLFRLSSAFFCRKRLYDCEGKDANKDPSAAAPLKRRRIAADVHVHVTTATPTSEVHLQTSVDIAQGMLLSHVPAVWI